MSYFKVLNNKSIVKADSRLFWIPIFKYNSLIEIGVKIDVFELFLSKSIINAENGVFLTLIFRTIPYRNRGENRLFSYFS